MSGKDLVCVGAIAGSFGVKGEVRLKSFCAEPAAISIYAPLSDESGNNYDVKITRTIKNGLAARLSGVSSKEAADALKGTRLFAPRDRLPELDDDEFYHADLLGMAVLDTGGTKLGSVKAVLNHGAGDLLEVNTGQGVVLLPFSLAVVPTVDLAGRRIVVDPPDGTFSDD
ncbi:MAG: 16S rRNA processing protein RimM [Dinoroseobacter sp.]|nr:16S rRNA processing protein RimM [Dinoroseobacter sp.]